jgi:peptide-methionine (S)-S-oxide reductase
MTRLFCFIIALAISGCIAGQADVQPSSQKLGGGQCQISFVDEGYAPRFSVNDTALEVPTSDDYQKAYFAMGCFWGSEALLASAPGVVATRVGFSGGTLANPSYSAIGDHVETVEVLYDPAVISYEQLLQHFWRHHNARAKPIFRQYASAVFCLEKTQIESAKKQRQAWQAEGKEKILTAVLPATEFYPAAENHQKYYLRQDPILLESLPKQDRFDTVLAAKLNAISGRAGERSDLEHTLTQFGIDTDSQEVLFSRSVWD